MRFDKILILVDDSLPSRNAAKHGYEFARDTADKVVLIYALDEALAMGDVDAGIFPGQALQELKKNAEKLLSHIKHKYSRGVETETQARVGGIKALLPGIIKQTQAKLIIMGTHGRTGIDRLIEGSVAESVLRISTIPVLVVPSK